MNSLVKKLLHNHCKSHLTSRLLSYQKRNDELYESLLSETKSSAGDKHETGRAMIQLEIEKTGNQIKETEKEYEYFLKTNNKVILKNVGNGSIVITNENLFYISVSAGVFNHGSKSYYCVSQNSPIGLELTGKKIKDIFIFKNKKSQIRNIL